MESSRFFVICLLHSSIAISCGGLIMFYLNEISVFGHGIETARKLSGSTPHDQLLIQTSHSFVGLLLCGIGFIYFMVAFVKDREFQGFFAKGCVILHLSMALWRVYFERRLEDLARDWPKQLVGDTILAISWVFFLVYSWREKLLRIGGYAAQQSSQFMPSSPVRLPISNPPLQSDRIEEPHRLFVYPPQLLPPCVSIFSI